MTATRAESPFASGTVVRRGDIELAVFQCGDPAAPPLLLIHGWPDTHLLWNEVAARLAGRFRVIAFDNRGAGASTVPAEVAAYRIEELAADVRAVLDAVVPDERVHILGHDWGSVIGWEVVSTPGAAERIASFTSLSGPNLDFLGAYLRGPVSARRLRGALEQGVASAYTVAFQIPGLPVPVMRLLSRRWPRFLAFFDGLDAAAVPAAPTLPADMINNLKLYRANIRARLRHPRPRPVEVPVQVLIATGDRAVRPVVHEEAERWVRDLTRTEIRARHWSPLSHPDEVAGRTADYIEAITARAGTGTARPGQSEPS
ncbi:alpha/beta fold hydrolase [Nocardia farcinica]|uniref:Fluoroacetate dehalogenase n=1 Tax=Nocardia farcinica TaxID=37329 RepID=A0A449GL91_NOCFR|nr:alpha/beta fold hydrolase [Nocardia farcinica]MBF6070033.1 alpha/beta fold hydrolase [Nocardia farcinica]MBF6251185.1 alpha/beta fold hydrolase [Nocardia farcinica]MBF6255278.1 alpha/beta fold hydrolase [Nocardia farcinica]MBF6263898.1 alpha/beta fold hydrolase [Nocardia farcinica]MBF6268643.1 alpha/beta fold hydrolase [Nocardia farcinica]